MTKWLAGIGAGVAAMLAALPLALADTAVAEAMGAAGAAAGPDDTKKFIALAAGFCVCVAAFAGALGQGRTASAALDGIARNPQASDKIFVPMLLGLAFIETLVIFSFLISILMYGKI
ncbi:MAG TPA: ATP synthase F0 subunit C [Myxococcota bacterium]|jgi:F-type H+-transporting ATPase subunit c|nr:ATP synthase F0 subunit C [Myxococcota bacterium]